MLVECLQALLAKASIQAFAAAEELEKLRDREKELGIDPDWDIDAFMKASNLRGKQQSIVTDYILRMLGLEVPNLP